MKYDLLTFVDAKRLGGGGKSERYYYDFAVNDRPISEIVNSDDLISPFGWLPPEFERGYFHQLLLRSPSELPSERVPLYICPECADLGCGCLTVRVAKYDDCFVWSEFGFENSYTEGLVESYEAIRDHVFQKTEYYKALNRFGFE